MAIKIIREKAIRKNIWLYGIGFVFKKLLLLDYIRSRRRLDNLSGYVYDREKEIDDEHIREVGVFQKILIKKK